MLCRAPPETLSPHRRTQEIAMSRFVYALLGTAFLAGLANAQPPIHSATNADELAAELKALLQEVQQLEATGEALRSPRLLEQRLVWIQSLRDRLQALAAPACPPRDLLCVRQTVPASDGDPRAASGVAGRFWYQYVSGKREPLRGEPRLLSLDGKEVIVETKMDCPGEFRLAVSPGKYLLSFPHCADDPVGRHEVTVRPGQWTAVEIILVQAAAPSAPAPLTPPRLPIP
jgi:hypothetical protein